MVKRKKQLPKLGKRTVKNQFEYDCYQTLKGIIPKRSLISYETEKIPYTIYHEYLPDIVIEHHNGSKIYVECKGGGRAFSSEVQRKMKEVRDQNKIDLRIIFYSDFKVGQKRKDGTFSRASDWAKKHNFKYYIGKEVPKDWLKE